MLPSALFGLAAFNQFIVYRVEPRGGESGKTDKFPCDYRTGKIVTAHDPQHWTDYKTAASVAAAWGESFGVGFVFTEADPFWFLDIDNCLTPEGWSPLAQQLCGIFAGAAVEVSRSGTGLHIFGTGQVPPHVCRNKAYGLEFYHTGRFVALTGNGAIGNCCADMSSLLPAVIATYFPPDAPAASSDAAPADGPVPEWHGPSEDTELIRRMMQSQGAAAAFGAKASFADLWLANESALAKFYPGEPYGASEADAALAQHLAFWTGKDAERMERLMRQSALYREKWDDHKTYLRELTIARAIARQVDVLQDARPTVAAAVDGAPVTYGPVQLTADGFLTPEQHQQHFAGCVYISSMNRALIPGGAVLKPDAFRVRYGGFTFRIDNINSKTTRDAWDAWTQSQIYKCPEAMGTCFRPQAAEREILEIDGQRLVNTYIPLSIPRKQGDAGPFLQHLAKVLPDERDRNILLSYMSACVQHQGTKFQWAPLLQGVEGNGKTLFARCVEQAVGERYTHWPMAKKLGKDFNAWMQGKVFYAVEDIYVPDSKREILEDLKPMITGTKLEIELKGVDQFAGEICGNFMFNSNHRDAIRKTENDRRFCVFYTAQQAKADLARDGMTGNYFRDLYDWLREDGYAIVNELLYTYAIPAEFNPAGDCQRAPVTSTTHEAIAASMGSVEQEINEAVEQGIPGFAGGWVSSTMLERFLEERRLPRLSPLKRKQMLEAMGYTLHPALADGRVNNLVTPDNGKPRLYVRRDALVLQITSAAEAARQYEAANSGRGAQALAAQVAFGR